MKYKLIKCEKCSREIKNNCIKRHIRTCKGIVIKEKKKRIAWNKGLDKSDPRIAKIAKKLSVIFKGRPGNIPTEAGRKKLSIARTAFMKANPHLAKRKPSWMENSFHDWLLENNIEHRQEVHFWNPILKKNYFVDFIFDQLQLIIELDGNQHLKRKEFDKKRDEFLTLIGYKVVRITRKEYCEKSRIKEVKGLLNLE